jgi:hypothetical protein
MALIHREPWILLAHSFSGPRVSAALAAIALMGPMAAAAQPSIGPVKDDVLRYSATTTNLDPDGLALRFDVLRWSDDEAAGAVIAALESEDIQSAIDDVATVGYIWPAGSPVGYSVKLARREVTDSGERLTFVTSKPLGSYDFGGWTVQGDAAEEALDYSVIELDVNTSGNGTGLASLATPVVVDSEGKTVRLNRENGSLVLFQDAHRLESSY